MLTINRKISAYNHYDYNNPIYISIHYVGACSTAYNNAVYFGGGDRGASAHYFVDDTSIWQVVEDNNGSWAVGNTTTAVNNTNSIAIEMCCDSNLNVTTTTENNTVELVAYLMKKYSIPIANVRTHAEITGYNKICPNWSANNWARWTSFKAKVQTELDELNGVNKVEYKNEYVVCYCNDIDKRCAEYLADFLGCECKDATVATDWRLYAENHICVGGNSSGSVGFSGYRTHWIQGSNRYKTAQEVLNVIFGTTKLDRWKV